MFLPLKKHWQKGKTHRTIYYRTTFIRERLGALCLPSLPSHFSWGALWKCLGLPGAALFKLIVHTIPRIFTKCRFWLSKSGVGPRILPSKQAPAPSSQAMQPSLKATASTYWLFRDILGGRINEQIFNYKANLSGGIIIGKKAIIMKTLLFPKRSGPKNTSNYCGLMKSGIFGHH